MSQRRERMLAGDEAALLERDRGPVRRYVRDIVDSRYNLLGLFMPVALGLMFIMMALPQIQLYISPAMMLLMVLMALRSEEHTSELQSRGHLVCRLLLEKKKTYDKIIRWTKSKDIQ